MILPLTDDEIAAAILRSGWTLPTKAAAREFRLLADALAAALVRKNEAPQ